MLMAVDASRWDRLLGEMVDRPGKFDVPWYLDAYKAALVGFEPKRVLEIGVDRGNSLSFWKGLWPDAEVHGVDCDADATAPDGTTLHRMTARDFLENHREPFDLVIDDGSHLDVDIQHTMTWAVVSPGGWLVVEDLVALFDERYSQVGCLAERVSACVEMVLASQHDRHSPPRLFRRYWDRIIVEPWIMFLRRSQQ